MSYRAFSIDVLKSVHHNNLKSGDNTMQRSLNPIQATLYLMNDGTLDKVHKAEENDSGFIDITDGVNWDEV